jgi:hypothetical protein
MSVWRLRFQLEICKNFSSSQLVEINDYFYDRKNGVEVKRPCDAGLIMKDK